MRIDSSLWKVPSKSLLRKVGQTIEKYKMIREGDRIMLGLSGGKDSLSLLHILHYFQRHAPIKFELAAITVDPEMETFQPEGLRSYLEKLGIHWFLVEQPIYETAKKHMKGDSFCSWCARMKRGVMYTTLRKEGFDVLALGQHLDDLAESFLMSAFYEGKLNTMKAHYMIDAGDLRVIRPLVTVREQQLADFAVESHFPIIIENCPACFSHPTKRQSMKELLAIEEQNQPQLFHTLLSTLRPLMDRS